MPCSTCCRRRPSTPLQDQGTSYPRSGGSSHPDLLPAHALLHPATGPWHRLDPPLERSFSTSTSVTSAHTLPHFGREAFSNHQDKGTLSFQALLHLHSFLSEHTSRVGITCSSVWLLMTVFLPQTRGSMRVGTKAVLPITVAQHLAWDPPRHVLSIYSTND